MQSLEEPNPVPLPSPCGRTPRPGKWEDTLMRRSVIAAAMMAAWVVWIGSAGAQPARPNQPAAPPADEPPPKPTDVTIAESARYGGHGENSIGLYKCVVRGELIRCNLLFTRYDAGS